MRFRAGCLTLSAVFSCALPGVGDPNDCSGDGVPDCNRNGIADTCDVQRSDPDGDLFVAHDCNGNAVPDSCETDPNDPDGDGDVLADCNGDRMIDTCSAEGWTERAKLFAPDAGAWDCFGYSADVCGDVAVLGACHHDGLGDNAGAAYVFRRQGDRWRFEQLLLASDGGAGDEFGADVAVHGTTILVGAPGVDQPRDSGAVYGFEFGGSGWNEVARLRAAQPLSSGRFGSAIELSASTLAVFSPATLTELYPEIHLFERVDGGWTLDGIVPLPGQFLTELSLWGQTLVVGRHTPPDSYEVTVLERRGTWIEVAALPPGGAALETSIHGRWLAAGDPGDRKTVRLYKQLGSAWHLRQELEAPAANAKFFGTDVVVGNGQLIVSSLGPERLHLYRLEGDQWEFERTIRPRSAFSFDGLARVLALSPGTLIVGAPGDDTLAAGAGAAYVVEYGSDCDGDGTLDECQVASGHLRDVDRNRIADICEPDCDGNGVPDAADTDTEDPDGDGYVALDCDGNRTPDACELGPATDADDDGVLDACELRGDLDGSGRVDLDDLLTVLLDFGCAGQPCAGDADHDGTTGLDDLLIVLQNFEG